MSPKDRWGKVQTSLAGKPAYDRALSLGRAEDVFHQYKDDMKARSLHPNPLACLVLASSTPKDSALHCPTHFSVENLEAYNIRAEHKNCAHPCDKVVLKPR